MRTLTVLLTLVLLAGCATPYVPPPVTQPTAKLRIAQVGDNTTKIGRLKQPCLNTGNHRALGDHIEWMRFEVKKDSPALPTLNMPDPPRDAAQFTEVLVDATQDFHFGYESNRFFSGYPQSTIRYCFGGVTFRPEPGANYEAVITSPSTMQCRLAFFRLSNSAGAPTRVPVSGAEYISRTCS